MMRCKWRNIFGISPHYNDKLKTGDYECRLKFYGGHADIETKIEAALKKYGFSANLWKFARGSRGPWNLTPYVNVYVPRSVAAELAEKAASIPYKALKEDVSSRPKYEPTARGYFTERELNVIRESLVDRKSKLYEKIENMIATVR